MHLSPYSSLTAHHAPRRLLAGLIPGVLLLSGCSGGGEAVPGPNVLLVTLDTTRADYLACYGHPEAKTPELDSLAADGVRFERAMSTAGITPMSHASILTGRNNYSHGLRVFHGELGHRLPDDIPSLPEILADRGWKTAAFVSAYPVSPAYGLNRGYQDFSTGIEESLAGLDLTKMQRNSELWQDARSNSTQRRGDGTVDDALGWLEQNGGEDPWHLWLHLFDVHDISLVPPQAYTRAEGVTYDPDSGPKDVEAREAMYLLELSYVDRQIGRVVSWLKDNDRYENTVIVVVADHGQGLSDGLRNHGWMLHRLLYDWSLHVPLIIKLPDSEDAHVIGDLVRTIDVLPTILELLDVPPPTGVEGRSLLSLVRGEADTPRIAYADALNAEDSHAQMRRLPASQQDNLYVAMDRRWKLIYHAHSPKSSQLFDLDSDSEERVNVFAQFPEEAERLLTFLRERDALRLVPSSDGSPAPNADALNDLGYTGDDE